MPYNIVQCNQFFTNIYDCKTTSPARHSGGAFWSYSDRDDIGNSFQPTLNSPYARSLRGAYLAPESASWHLQQSLQPQLATLPSKPRCQACFSCSAPVRWWHRVWATKWETGRVNHGVFEQGICRGLERGNTLCRPIHYSGSRFDREGFVRVNTYVSTSHIWRSAQTLILVPKQ